MPRTMLASGGVASRPLPPPPSLPLPRPVSGIKIFIISGTHQQRATTAAKEATAANASCSPRWAGGWRQGQEAEAVAATLAATQAAIVPFQSTSVTDFKETFVDNTNKCQTQRQAGGAGQGEEPEAGEWARDDDDYDSDYEDVACGGQWGKVQTFDACLRTTPTTSLSPGLTCAPSPKVSHSWR